VEGSGVIPDRAPVKSRVPENFKPMERELSISCGFLSRRRFLLGSGAAMGGFAAVALAPGQVSDEPHVCPKSKPLARMLSVMRFEEFDFARMGHATHSHLPVRDSYPTTAATLPDPGSLRPTLARVVARA
jgi:hypothetical protein